MGAVADHWKRLFRERRDNQLAFCTIGQHFIGFRINDFNKEVIFKNMQAGLFTAFDTDAGADNFRQAVNIKRFDSGFALNISTHGFGPRLRAEHTDFHTEISE